MKPTETGDEHSQVPWSTGPSSTSPCFSKTEKTCCQPDSAKHLEVLLSPPSSSRRSPNLLLDQSTSRRHRAAPMEDSVKCALSSTRQSQHFLEAGHSPKSAKHKAPAPHHTLLCSHYVPGCLHICSHELLGSWVYKRTFSSLELPLSSRDIVSILKEYIHVCVMIWLLKLLEMPLPKLRCKQDHLLVTIVWVLFDCKYERERKKRNKRRERNIKYMCKRNSSYTKIPCVNHRKNPEATETNGAVPSSCSVTTLTAVKPVVL